MPEASYVVLLARAVPSLTPHQIDWEIPCAKGWAWIHAARLLDGEPMIWPDPAASRTGRWWQGFKRALRLRRRH